MVTARAVRRSLRSVRRAARKVFHCWSAVVLVADLRALGRDEESLRGDLHVDVNPARREEALRYLQDVDERWYGEVVGHLGDDDIPVVTELGGEIVYVGWLRTDLQRDDLAREIVAGFPGPSAWSWGGYVPRPHRRRGIGSAMCRQVLRYGQRVGWRWMWCGVQEWNTTSLRIRLNQGYQIVATKAKWILFGHPFYMYRLLVPYEALRTRGENVPGKREVECVARAPDPADGHRLRVRGPDGRPVGHRRQ
jgi:GNAT superfamily N-acetyltransferase